MSIVVLKLPDVKVIAEKRPHQCLSRSGLAILVLVPLIYYCVQVLLRTPPLTLLQNIAHRGGLTYEPENTLAAFQNGINQGIDWLEFDAQMTKDGALENLIGLSAMRFFGADGMMVNDPMALEEK